MLIYINCYRSIGTFIASESFFQSTHGPLLHVHSQNVIVCGRTPRKTGRPGLKSREGRLWKAQSCDDDVRV